MMDIYASGDLRKLSSAIYMAVNCIAEDFDAGNYPLDVHSGFEEMTTALRNANEMPAIFSESDRVLLPFPRAPAVVQRRKDGVTVSLTDDPDGYFSRVFRDAFRDEGVQAEVQ